MIFDGDCNFCRFWIRRWNRATRDAIDYLPFQDPAVLARFPEIPRSDFESAVKLIETDGSVYRGAQAAFRALAYNPRKKWLLAWYKHSPAFAKTSEWGYRLVATHRGFSSALTRLAWGRDPEPATHSFTAWLFLRSLGLIYLVAFVSLWVQIIGLVGAKGILPAHLTMETNRQLMAEAKVGLEHYHQVPTLCWFNASDRFLKFQCAAGTLLAILLIIGFASVPCLFLLWLIYLSLATVCREFLGFQWDNLLLEAGFLAIFLPRLQLLPGLSRAGPPSRIVLWLLRWLLFRLMFESGCVKLLSHDPTWSDLTALTFHYETQPLPTWIAWHVHHLPVWMHKASCLLMFGVELVVPFFIFGPRRLRIIAGLILIVFQISIFLTGNYCFFNLLTILLCFALFDDHALRAVVLKFRITEARAVLGSQRARMQGD